MKPIKVLGLTVFVGLMAMALDSVPTAIAESTVACKVDQDVCKNENIVVHGHGTTVSPALLLNSLGNIKCDVLTLGDGEGLGAPAVGTGTATFSSCFRKKIFGGEESCTVKELNGPAFGVVLKEGHETAKVTGEGEIEVKCGSAIECVYNGEGLAGTAKGPLLSTQANGEVTIANAVTHKVKGSLCPEEAKLDGTMVALEPVYASR